MLLLTAGKLPKHNNVSWRGNSCLNDGKDDNSVASIGSKDLVGGYYDAGDAIKFNFPASFAMTMLSWSVIEYSGKYEAAGELNHVKEIIKWGTDYFLKCFNSTSDDITRIVSQVSFPIFKYLCNLKHSSVLCWICKLTENVFFVCFDRLELVTHLKARKQMIITVGHAPRILTTIGQLLSVVRAQTLLRRWLQLWLLPPLYSRMIRHILRNLYTVLKLFSNFPGASVADTVLALMLKYSTILLVIGMSLCGVHLGYIMLLEIPLTFS